MDDYYQSLLFELARLPRESEWVEFKQNNDNPEAIGEYISALSNSAALVRRPYAYLIWGIQDGTCEIVGTTFRFAQAKKGQEALESWLLRLLSPNILFTFHEIMLPGKVCCLLEIEAAQRQPVQFQGQEFIRIGSYKKKLKDYPETERCLWQIFDTTPFERKIACKHLTEEQVLERLDHAAYFTLLNQPAPAVTGSILQTLSNDGLIFRNDAGTWDISNLGAVLFAKNIEIFPALRRKAVRVIHYQGEGRIETIQEKTQNKGYACGFSDLIAFVNSLLPSNEVIGQALRRQVPMFPELAIRELVANAIIHQDFSQTGNGPMIEIFKSRMEITNPGAPLIAVDRLLDAPPRSRNESLASLMRRVGICEERGSGVDKVVLQTENFQLPAPMFEIVGANTKSILFAHKPLVRMEKPEKIRACYLHACLRFVQREPMTNTSLRDRFNIPLRNRAIISRIIKDAMEAKLILPFDPAQGRRHAKYIPFWAAVPTN